MVRVSVRAMRPEVSGLCSFHILNIRIEHRSQFRPQSHANSVMIEIEYRDSIPLLHESPKLFV
jgi:hypothetical protein